MKEMQEQMAAAQENGFDISALTPEEQAMLAQMTPEEQQAYIATIQSTPALSVPAGLTDEQVAMLATMSEEEQAAYLASLQTTDVNISIDSNGATAPTIDIESIPEMDIAGIDLSQLTEEQLAYFSSMTEEEQQEMMELYTEAALKATVVSPSTYYDNITSLGVIDLEKPASILIYPIDFEAKENITQIISDYNTRMEANGEENKVITYTDMVGMLMSSVTDIIDAISYILIAFVAISLVVSSIMIGIITYISVLERTKEIGILRSIGASKKDISRVFNAETIIVGLVAGAIGIGVTVLLNIPINIIIENITDIAGLSVLPPVAGIILVCISVALTFIAGLFPSKVAANKDPVVALRTE